MSNSPTTDTKEPRPEKPPEVKQATTKQERKEAPPEDHRASRWSLTDEKNWETFPASDAAASWAGRDLTPEERAAKQRERRAPDLGSRRRFTPSHRAPPSGRKTSTR